MAYTNHLESSEFLIKFITTLNSAAFISCFAFQGKEIHGNQVDLFSALVLFFSGLLFIGIVVIIEYINRFYYYSRLNKIIHSDILYSTEAQYLKIFEKIKNIKTIPILLPLSFEVCSIICWVFGILLSLDAIHPFLNSVVTFDSLFLYPIL